MIPGGGNSSCKSTFLNQFKCKGTDRALLSMFKSDAFGDYRSLTQISGKQHKKMLLLRGKTDKEITQSMINQVREDLPECQFMELENSGHSPGTDSADTLNKIIVDFVKSE
jgi:pimeloyl-ACP methyl ester carboxylesterase